MSKLFGDKRNFALEYKFLPNPYEEGGVYGDSWGMLKFWIKGVDICLYQQDNSIRYYEWNLYFVIEWLCEKLEYILGYDPFPLPVEGDNVLELMLNADEYDNDDSCEFDLWYGAKSRWVFNHCWFSNRDGSILPCIYFRRLEKKVEISWDNKFWEKEGIMFLSAKDSYNLSYVEFKQVLSEFLNSIIVEMEQQLDYKKDLKDLKKSLEILN